MKNSLAVLLLTRALLKRDFAKMLHRRKLLVFNPRQMVYSSHIKTWLECQWDDAESPFFLRYVKHILDLFVAAVTALIHSNML